MVEPGWVSKYYLVEGESRAGLSPLRQKKKQQSAHHSCTHYAVRGEPRACLQTSLTPSGKGQPRLAWFPPFEGEPDIVNHFTLSSDIKPPAQRTRCVFGSVGASRNEARVLCHPETPRASRQGVRRGAPRVSGGALERPGSSGAGRSGVELRVAGGTGRRQHVSLCPAGLVRAPQLP